MLPLSANPDFINQQDATIESPYYDLNVDNINEHIELYGTAAIDQAIEMVLCTEKYERIFNLSLSSPLYDLLFENMVNVDEKMNEVYNQIEYWVPIMILRDYTEIETYPAEHSIRFKIPYISKDGRYKSTFHRIISK